MDVSEGASRGKRQAGKWPRGGKVAGSNGTSLGIADLSLSFSGCNDEDVPRLRTLTGLRSVGARRRAPP